MSSVRRLRVILLLLLCLTSAGGKFCEEEQYRCPNGTCIPKTAVRDGVEDCEGGYEEKGPLCGDDEVPCAQDGACIPRDRLEDKINHCGDNSDEFKYPCPQGEFTCRDSLMWEEDQDAEVNPCVPLDRVRNGVKDCNDGSDEEPVLGAQCNETSDNCHEYITHSHCRGGVCRCHFGYSPVGVGECVRISQDDVSALGTNSICTTVTGALSMVIMAQAFN